jgi:hypothetical protein
MSRISRPSLLDTTALRPLLLALLLMPGLVTAACGSDSPEPADDALPAPAEALGEADSDAADPAADDADNAAGLASSTNSEAGDSATADSADADAPADAADAAGMAATGDPEAIEAMSAAFAAQSKEPSWRMRQTIVSSGAGETMEQVMEYAAPDRYHMTMQQMELIMIGGRTWLNMGETWVENGSLGQAIAGTLDQLPNPETLSASGMPMADVEDLGTESIDGKAATKIGYTLTHPEGSLTGTLWIAQDSGLPLRQLMKTSYGEFDAEITSDFEYGDKIEIEAPTS